MEGEDVGEVGARKERWMTAMCRNSDTKYTTGTLHFHSISSKATVDAKLEFYPWTVRFPRLRSGTRIYPSPRTYHGVVYLDLMGIISLSIGTRTIPKPVSRTANAHHLIWSRLKIPSPAFLAANAAHPCPGGNGH